MEKLKCCPVDPMHWVLKWCINATFQHLTSQRDFNALLIRVENGFEAQHVEIFQDIGTLDWFIKYTDS